MSDHATTPGPEGEAADLQESRDLAVALRWGIGLGTPITFVVFFAILLLAGVSLSHSLVTAIWVAIVGGAFYGGVAAMLRVLNRYGH